MSGDRLPALLTVEEAGALLRIGRTKAYAMAREWRETGGRSGLPVVDLGHVLRVPRRALEELVGAELTDAVSPSEVEAPVRVVAPAELAERRTSKSPRDTPPQTSPTIGRTRGPQRRFESQLDLFDPKTRSS